jgi:hypothetical protein
VPGISAVIVPIALPAPLASIREADDPLAARGVPAHVTVLFPFLAAPDLTPADRSALAQLAARRAPFIARFSQVEVHEAMVWLVPDRQQPFLDLIDSVASRWPNHPPYGGIHDTLLPHLTFVETRNGRALGAARVAAAESGPFEVIVREVTVITERASGAWRTRWRLPMGDRTTRAPDRPVDSVHD